MKRIFLPFIIITCLSLVLMQCEKNEDEKDIHWTNYTTSDGLVNDEVFTLDIDGQGNKWFGTRGGISFYITLTV